MKKQKVSQENRYKEESTNFKAEKYNNGILKNLIGCVHWQNKYDRGKNQ